MFGTFDLTNCFYFVTVISTFDTLLPSVFFVINLLTHMAVALFVLDEVLIVLIPSVKPRHIHFACIISLNKLHDNKPSQIDIFTNKLDNTDSTTIL